MNFSGNLHWNRAEFSPNTATPASDGVSSTEGIFFSQKPTLVDDALRYANMVEGALGSETSETVSVTPTPTTSTTSAYISADFSPNTATPASDGVSSTEGLFLSKNPIPVEEPLRYANMAESALSGGSPGNSIDATSTRSSSSKGGGRRPPVVCYRLLHTTGFRM